MYYLTEGICYEFLRVSTHPEVFPFPLKAGDAPDFPEGLLASRSVNLLQQGSAHRAALRRLAGTPSFPAGNLVYNMRAATLMPENGVRTVYTADRGFLQFKDLEVIDPLS